MAENEDGYIARRPRPQPVDNSSKKMIESIRNQPDVLHYTAAEEFNYTSSFSRPKSSEPYQQQYNQPQQSSCMQRRQGQCPSMPFQMAEASDSNSCFCPHCSTFQASLTGGRARESTSSYDTSEPSEASYPPPNCCPPAPRCPTSPCCPQSGDPDEELTGNKRPIRFKFAKASMSHDDPQYLDGARRVLEHSFNLWKEQQMCDVTFEYDHGQMHGHKVVLSAHSQFLVTRFNEYSHGEVVNIDMTDFTQETLATVLRYAYTMELDLTDTNVGPVMKCSDELGLTTLTKLCMGYLSKLTVDNAIIFFSIAENYELNEMRTKSMAFISSHFVEVSSSRHWNFLPPERLITLLASDSLNVKSELDVFNAAIRWLDFDRSGRLCYFANVLAEGVRLHCIPPENIVRSVEPVICDLECPECEKAVNDALRYQALSMSGSRLAMMGTPKQKPRSCRQASLET